MPMHAIPAPMSFAAAGSILVLLGFIVGLKVNVKGEVRHSDKRK
jgi:hypothetical protein